MSINDIFNDQISLKKWGFNYLINNFHLNTMKSLSKFSYLAVLMD